MAEYRVKVNGTVHMIEADPDMPLLYALRDDLDGQSAFRLRARPMRRLHRAARRRADALLRVAVSTARQGAKITTLAGLGTPEHPHKLQPAFIEEQVPQCGYCLNGWIMTAAALLKTKTHPSEAEIREALTGLKCRCGTHLGDPARGQARGRSDAEGGRDERDHESSRRLPPRIWAAPARWSSIFRRRPGSFWPRRSRMATAGDGKPPLARPARFLARRPRRTAPSRRSSARSMAARAPMSASRRSSPRNSMLPSTSVAVVHGRYGAHRQPGRRLRQHRHPAGGSAMRNAAAEARRVLLEMAAATRRCRRATDRRATAWFGRRRSGAQTSAMAS